MNKKQLKLVQYATFRLKLSGVKGKVTWSSSDKTIAKVSSKGKVTAVGAGRCTITAKYNEKQYVCKVKVTALKASQKSIKLVRYRQLQVVLNNPYITPRWSSSNEQVATVSENGTVTAMAGGQCIISVDYRKTVINIPLQVVAPTPETLTAMHKQAKAEGKTRVVIAGSSSIDYWSTAYEDFASYEIVNTGIAGTTVTQWLTWYKQLITRYQPDAVILYVGANDIKDGDNISGETNAANTKRLLRLLKKSIKKVPIYYVSIYPCWYRPHAWDDIKVSNELIRAYCGTKKYLNFIDLTQALTNEDGTPKKDLFAADLLHLNARGYKIWKKLVANVVKKDLKAAAKKKK